MDNGTDTASSFYTKDQNYNQSNRHDDTLDKVRCGSSKKSAKCCVCYNYDSTDNHGGQIIYPE